MQLIVHNLSLYFLLHLNPITPAILGGTKFGGYNVTHPTQNWLEEKWWNLADILFIRIVLFFDGVWNLWCNVSKYDYWCDFREKIYFFKAIDKVPEVFL